MAKLTPLESPVITGDAAIADQTVVDGLNRLLGLNVGEQEKLKIALQILALTGNVDRSEVPGQPELPATGQQTPARPPQDVAPTGSRIVTRADMGESPLAASKPSVASNAPHDTPPVPSAGALSSSATSEALLPTKKPAKSGVVKSSEPGEMSATSIDVVPIKPSRTKAKIVVAGMAVLATSGAMVAASPEQSTLGEMRCTDGTEPMQVGRGSGPEAGLKDKIRLVVDRISPYEDNRQWSELAKRFGRERGYYISGERLAAANVNAKNVKDGGSMQLAEYDKGVLEETIRVVGEYCFTVPAPIVGGQIETDKADTLKLVAAHTNTTPTELRKLNPGLPEDEDELLGAGKVVQVSKKLDPSLVLQQADERDLKSVADPKSPQAKEAYARVLGANAPVLAKGGDLNSGIRYWPPKQKPAEKGQKAPQEPPVVKPAPSDFAEKPKPQEQAPEAPAKPVEEESGTPKELTAEQQKQLAAYAEALKAVPEAKLKNVCSPLVLAQAIDRSNWGTSAAAKEKNNPFGLVDDDDNLRTFGSLQEGIEAFVDRIIKSPYNDPRFFPDQAPDSCDANSRTFLLSGETDRDVRRVLIFNYLMSKDKKLTQDHVAGIVGNFVRESNIDPTKKQYGGGPGRGLAQWEGGRLTHLVEFAQKRGQNWQDFHTQLDFVLHELHNVDGHHGREKIAYNELIKTHNPREAARVFSNEYERPGIPAMHDRVKGAQTAATAYAKYEVQVRNALRLVKDYNFAGMLGKNDVQGAIKVPASRAAAMRQAGPFKLDPSKYRDTQNNPVRYTGKGASAFQVDVNNDGKSETPSKNTSKAENLKIIERELNGAQAKVTVENFKAFQIADISDKVEKDFRNFDGSRNGLGAPKSTKAIHLYVAHFTATPSRANNSEAYGFARGVQNADRGVGFNFLISQSAQTTQLSKDYGHHTLPHNGLNYKIGSRSVEIMSSVQAEMNSDQYAALVNLFTKYLIEDGKVAKGVPVSPIVKTMVLGHREANDADGMHSDMPAIVMDPVREMIIGLLEDLGYIR